MDTAIYGPGVWLCLHLLAYRADDDKSKTDFIEFLNVIRQSYPCAKCRKHMNDYIQANPVHNHWMEDKGFFKWSWLFHNAVNQRLGKPLVSYDEAEAKYGGVHVCTAGCEEESTVQDWRQLPQASRQIPRTYPRVPNRYRGHNY